MPGAGVQAITITDSSEPIAIDFLNPKITVYSGDNADFGTWTITLLAELPALGLTSLIVGEE